MADFDSSSGHFGKQKRTLNGIIFRPPGPGIVKSCFVLTMHFRVMAATQICSLCIFRMKGDQPLKGGSLSHPIGQIAVGYPGIILCGKTHKAFKADAAQIMHFFHIRNAGRDQAAPESKVYNRLRFCRLFFQSQAVRIDRGRFRRKRHITDGSDPSGRSTAGAVIPVLPKSEGSGI